ncbi:MAG: hypothetical protein IPP52_08790 [Ignavibacteria bacterium]|nr:hypothetical protein [Ignavibacteria bacterium]
MLIDFPQVTEIRSNPHAKELLRRDIASVFKSFKKYKPDADEERFLKSLHIAHRNGHDFV